MDLILFSSLFKCFYISKIEHFAKSPLPGAKQLILKLALLSLNWMNSEETKFVYMGKIQEPHESVEEPYAPKIAWHLLHLLQLPGHTLVWDDFPIFIQHMLQVSQHGCVVHSGTNFTSKLKPPGLLAGHSIPSTPRFWVVVSGRPWWRSDRQHLRLAEPVATAEWAGCHWLRRSGKHCYECNYVSGSESA